MMKRALNFMANLTMTLLLVTVCSAAVYSQDANRGRARRPLAPQHSSGAQAAPNPGMGLEEKLVRDVYARLMRYQSAGLDESQDRGGKVVGPKDYLTFELQNIHSGSIAELQGRSLSEVVTARGGEVLNVRPVYLRVKNDPAFAFYEAEWTTLPEVKNESGSQQENADFQGYERYTSYVVTVRLNGKQRQYRALAVYRLNENDTEGARPKTFQILDNVTAETNTVYADESPLVRIPWSQYVKTGSYRAVVKRINDLKAAGKPILPSSLPVGEGDPGGDPPPPDPEPDPTSTCAAPRISGPTNVWWFNGQLPTGYATSITLTASPATGSSYSWTLVSGNDKVVLTNFVNNTVRVTGTNQSTFREVGIRVNVDGVDSAVYRLSVRAPHRLVLIQDFVHAADATWGYNTSIHYRIEDQFTDVLPSDVAINEQWTTGLVADFAGMNWGRGPEGWATVGPTNWRDYIEGERAGHTPAPRNPCTPSLCNTAVYHWGGQWFVGSPTIGSGRRVQTNTWQKYTDHAEHTNRVSPAP